jgi:hypothetical protein
MSSRPELQWLGYDALLHCTSGDLNASYRGVLSYEQRRLLVTLESTDRQAIESAVHACQESIEDPFDDADVENDHVQHLLAIGVYTPAYALMLQGVNAQDIAHRVRHKAQAILSYYYARSFEDELSQVMFNAVSTFPEYLHQLFPKADRWVVTPLGPRASLKSLAGPILGNANSYSASMNASVGFFFAHYGASVKPQLMEHAQDDPNLLKAMLTEGSGYVKCLDEHLAKQHFRLDFVLPLIEKIAEYPKAWAQYSSQAVCNAFAPLLDVPIKSTVGAQYAAYFTQAIQSHPALKTFIIEQWIASGHVSLVDLKFTGLGSKDIPEMLDRLSRDDLTGILETELGL